MTTNPYFRKNVPSEQQLANSLTVECIQIHGQDFLYIPRETVAEDFILGERTSKFTDANRIEMYFDSPASGFAPSPPSTGDLISKFGLEVPDQGTFIVSRTRFLEVMSHNADIRKLGRPREGDLIYMDYANALFEIMFVEDEMPFYTFGAKTTFQLSCQKFITSHEEMDTGETDVDENMLITSSFIKTMVLGTATTGTNYEIGELVYSGSIDEPTAEGKVYAWTLATKTLQVIVQSQSEAFVVGASIVGGTSATAYPIVSITDSTTRSASETSQDNEEIAAETRNDLFDFTETDPFSTGNYGDSDT